MPFGLGIGELLVILLVVVLIFGARRIPLIARGLGLSIRNFKGELQSGDGPDDHGGSDPDGN